MKRTTVFLTDEIKAALEAMSAATGRSEAALIREAVATFTKGTSPNPPPRFPLFESGDPIAHRVDELLHEGFGLD